MNYLKATAALAILITSVAVGVGISRAASTNTLVCASHAVNDINAATPGASDVDYTFNVPGQGQTATAQVKAGANCAGNDVSLVSYQAPAQNGLPLTSQTLFDSQTKTMTTGVVTLSVKVPNCFYQVDLVHGKPIDLSQGVTYSNHSLLIAHDNNGQNVCTPGSGGGGTTPENPPTTTTTVSNVTVLPATGAGAQ